MADAQRAIQFGLHNVADKLGRILESGSWKDFVTPTGLPVKPTSFVKFVTNKRPEGLETDIETVRRVCQGHVWIIDLLDRELQRPVGTNQHTEPVSNRHTLRPAGDTAEAALRRLRKERPDLHARVIDETDPLTAHAAAVEAGFRSRRFSVPGDPKRAAVILLRHLAAEDVQELIRHLKGEVGE